MYVKMNLRKNYEKSLKHWLAYFCFCNKLSEVCYFVLFTDNFKNKSWLHANIMAIEIHTRIHKKY